MANTFYDRYLEAEVLTADPLKLVWFLYRGAIEAVRMAREHLAHGDIRGRAQQINRAWGILRELRGALDHAKGGEISRQLASLYSYMQGRLIEANVKQADQPLDEVVSLLTTLAEGWGGACQSADSAGDAHSVPGRFAAAGEEADATRGRAALALG